MYLLNTKTLKLEMFMGTKIPEYAILSHTWVDGEEPSFQEMQQGTADRKAGFTKIEYACAQAADDGLTYVWVDTVCIDKSSSAELSEAINSMYKWYYDAKICYAYLADLPEKALAQSRWFTRGWTLQELIAPSVVVFYSSDWSRIATRSDLRQEISTFARIHSDVLNGVSLDRFSVAQRMSWATERTTTRPEDLAYCLLGIFGVNMALLYGEGDRAFIRLQEEIMKGSDDQSLFAWEPGPPAPATHGGLLATAPSQFTSSGNIVPYRGTGSISVPYAMTNKGLRITMNLAQTEGVLMYTGLLECLATDRPDETLVIYLKRVSTVGDQFMRVVPAKIKQMKPRWNSKRETIYIRQQKLLPQLESVKNEVFWITKGSSNLEFKGAWTSKSESIPLPSIRQEFPIPNGSNGWVVLIKFKYEDANVYNKFSLLLGFTPHLGVLVQICTFFDSWLPQALFDHYNPRSASKLEAILEPHFYTFREKTVIKRRVFVELGSQMRSETRLHTVDIRVQDVV